MGLFKIKLIPKIKERNWEISHIRHNRKEKTCEVCGNKLPIATPSTTFNKRTTKGLETEYETHHTCPYIPNPGNCVEKMVKKLGINESECWIN